MPERSNIHFLELVGLLFKEANIEYSIEDISPYFLSIQVDETLLQSKMPQFNLKQPFILIFPETGEPLRMLSEDFWFQMINELMLKSDIKILVCGQTTDTANWKNKLINNNLSIITSGLNISDLASISRQAAVTLSLESFPVHLCSIYSPTISFFNNGAGFMWFPMVNYPSVLFHNHYNSRELSLPNLKSIYVDEKIESEQVINITVNYVLII